MMSILEKAPYAVGGSVAALGFAGGWYEQLKPLFVEGHTTDYFALAGWEMAMLAGIVLCLFKYND